MIKSKVLVFGSQIQRQPYLLSRWWFDGRQLECVDQYIYLGITFHFSGNFKLAQKYLYNKALGAYHGLLSNFTNVERLPIRVLLKLFSSLVVPILLYGSDIWGAFILGRIPTLEVFKEKMFRATSDLERLHLKFCKRILGVHSKATNLAVYGEISRAPLFIQIASAVV